MSKQKYVFVGFALAFVRLATASTFVFNANSWDSISEVLFFCRRTLCCSSPWPTYSIHEKFWPTSENCLCSQIQFYFALHIYLAGSWLWLAMLVQFWYSLESKLSGQMKFSISWQSVFTTCHSVCKLWELFSVLCHEALSDYNCCQESSISTNFNHMVLLFLCNFAINLLVQELGSKVYVFSSTKLLVQTMGQTALPARVSHFLAWQALYSSHKSQTAS